MASLLYSTQSQEGFKELAQDRTVDRWVLEEPGGLSPETEFSATEPDKHTHTYIHIHVHP